MNFFQRKPKHQWTPGQMPTAQGAYVNTRQLELQQERDVNVRAALELLDADLERWVYHRSPSMRELREAYQKLHMHLQRSDLTINFPAERWFVDENKYETYTQMYERAVGQDGELHLQGNVNNPVNRRVAADDAVTIPEQWRNQEVVTRGLAPRQNQVRIAQRMVFDEVVPNGKGYKSSNPHFDPKTKQVFAALNYAGNPNGATTDYGYSFFVLKPQLKVNALYYPGDTFTLQGTGVSTQMSFAHLGAIYGKITNGFSAESYRRDLLNTCFPNVSKGTAFPMLLEGHLFTQLRFADALESVNLSRRNVDGQPFTEPQWKILTANAKKFAKKWNVKLNTVA